MSGFQDVAAAIGLAELALRSISRIHEFVVYLKNVPESVERLRTELCQLDSCLAELSTLHLYTTPAQAVVRRLDLSAVVIRCGDICADLETSLRKWTEGGPDTLASRLRVRFNKAQIEDAIQSIASARGAILLAVSITSLHLQVSAAETMSMQRKPVPSRQQPDKSAVSARTIERVDHTKNSGQAKMNAGMAVVTVTAQAILSTKDIVGSPDVMKQESSEHEYKDDWKARYVEDVRSEALEDQIVEDNEVLKSADTSIGVVSAKLKRQVIRGNKVIGSQNTTIGGVLQCR
ncbi:hypothetical protein LTR78_004852 [Recurvomyces mirabilis]|uniref:Azaphilone pigments biosynthesis cluster protein L N-terminal domain-containing protein n=1 Tax=Recurvomyces mirabilis TaxID=574656 RepID=A0AAE0WP71_9PEZI|nr:hypothetical protein LTR78_004852 [Recurvomyces mirabilis]KAK5158023.1 hypothetical protein LTS14_003946 [Recurvomyces mirabilis]